MKKKMKKREKTKRELRIAHKGTSFVCPQTDRGLFSSLRITYNSILLALFYRKSQDNEIKVWSKALLVGEGWKENKIDECSTTLQTEKLHLFSLKRFCLPTIRWLQFPVTLVEKPKLISEILEKIRLRIAVPLFRQRSCICLLSNQLEIPSSHY